MNQRAHTPALLASGNKKTVTNVIVQHPADTRHGKQNGTFRTIYRVSTFSLKDRTERALLMTETIAIYGRPYMLSCLSGSDRQRTEY